MISVMTVKIISLSQTLTDGGIALACGTLEFSNYSRDGVIITNLSYEAYGITAVALMNAGVNSNCVAVGYIDLVNKLPVFKLQNFATISLPNVAVEVEKETAKIPFN